MRVNRRSQRAGFTLVEMLVVIVIIGILAGLLLPAIGMVRDRALNARVAMETSNLEKSVEAYKLKYGDYPPNFTDGPLVKRHVLKAWPKIDNTELQLFLAYVQANPVDPAESLVFWMSGFSSDARRPFTGRGGPLLAAGSPLAITGPNPERDIGVYEFDQGRLDYTDDADAFPVYAPKGRNAPYVYFDARTYSFIQSGQPTYTIYTTTAMGTAVPYKSNRTNPSFNAAIDPPDQLLEFANPRTFQIVSAGLDDLYGTGQTLVFNDLPSSFPSSPYGGANLPVFLNFVTKQPFFPHSGLPGIDSRISPDFHGGHVDNVSNFSGGGKLEDVEE